MGTRHLIGSPAKDAFNFWHKTRLPKNFYAIDIDLCLLRRAPHDVIAVIDYKAKGKENPKNLGLGYSHVNLYNRLIDFGIPVYIVWGLWNNKVGNEVMFSDFDIYRYIGGDPEPDNTPFEYTTIRKSIDEKGFFEWENEIRRSYEPKVFSTISERDEYFKNEIDKIIQYAFDIQRGYLVEFDASYLSGIIIQTAYSLKGKLGL